MFIYIVVLSRMFERERCGSVQAFTIISSI